MFLDLKFKLFNYDAPCPLLKHLRIQTMNSSRYLNILEKNHVFILHSETLELFSSLKPNRINKHEFDSFRLTRKVLEFHCKSFEIIFVSQFS